MENPIVELARQVRDSTRQIGQLASAQTEAVLAAREINALAIATFGLTTSAIRRLAANGVLGDEDVMHLLGLLDALLAEEKEGGLAHTLLSRERDALAKARKA